MNTLVHQRKATMFRLDIELLERLKELAKKEHRSLNNFVECMLLDIAYNKPNKETIEAINDARNGKLEDGELDISSVDAFLNSAEYEAFKIHHKIQKGFKTLRKTNRQNRQAS